MKVKKMIINDEMIKRLRKGENITIKISDRIIIIQYENKNIDRIFAYHQSGKK